MNDESAAKMFYPSSNLHNVQDEPEWALACPKTAENTANRNCGTVNLTTTPVQMLVSVEGNKSLPLIWSPAVLVGSISGPLSRWPFKPRHRVSYLGLISSVLPVKDPWLLGLCWPCIDLSLVLLLLSAFLLCEFSLSNLLHTYFFMQLCWWQLERDGDIAFTFFFWFTQIQGSSTQSTNVSSVVISDWTANVVQNSN